MAFDLDHDTLLVQLKNVHLLSHIGFFVRVEKVRVVHIVSLFGFLVDLVDMLQPFLGVFLAFVDLELLKQHTL